MLGVPRGVVYNGNGIRRVTMPQTLYGVRDTGFSIRVTDYVFEVERKTDSDLCPAKKRIWDLCHQAPSGGSEISNKYCF